MSAYCQVILADATRAFDRPFTYRVPPQLADALSVGSLVEVPFGTRSQPARAFVVGLEAPADDHFTIKDIGRLLSERPVLWPDQISLAAEMRERWLCAMGDALRSMVPAAVSAVGDRSVRFASLIDPEEAARRLAEGELSRLGQQRVVELLLDCGQAPVQEIMSACHVSRSVLQTLEKRGWISQFTQAVPRPELLTEPPALEAPFEPNRHQQQAISAILEDLARIRQGPRPEQPAEQILYGITGSGKTEVYLQAARSVVDQGLGVIILVPEISLTPQMMTRLQARFGAAIAVLHSRLTPAQRHEQWQRILRGDVLLVVGARSAVFAPLRQIGLIVVDEEQEASYKSESNPRYHARTVARMRAREHGAVLVLGSATPSVETYARHTMGYARLLVLPDRIGAGGLARAQVVDMRQELADGNRGIFSRKLIQAMEQTLARGQQAMILINRRGYSGFVLCRDCGQILRCPSCSVSMTVHTRSHPQQQGLASIDQLICHYCGRIKAMPQSCPTCKGTRIGRFGAGTQQVEAAFQQAFPQARTLRMDQDTTIGRSAHARLLAQFENHEADVLIGTQMIAKGHDYPNVTLVGVLSADLMLGLSDFRASERAFQLITQAAGRSGRGDQAGVVLIQAYNVDDYAIRFAAAQDFTGFFQQELLFRKRMTYPPFGSVCLITCSSAADEPARAASQALAAACQARQQASDDWAAIQLFPPGPAPLRRLRNRYRHRLVVKGSTQRQLAAFLAPVVDRSAFKDVAVAVDFDPYQML